MLLHINPVHPEPRKIARAVEVIDRGGILAYPTDTVYGLGCDPRQRKAVDRLYAIKQMGRDQPLAILVPDLGNIATYALVGDLQYRTMRRLVPGPYCFILPATRETPKMLQTKRKTIGVRVPDHPVPRALLEALGRPLISTSASWQGEILIDPDEIDQRFDVDLILDAGAGGDVPSTVVSLLEDEPEVLREGKGDLDDTSTFRRSHLASAEADEE